MILISTPLALGVAIQAVRRADDRAFAVAALAIAGLETLLLFGGTALATCLSMVI